MERKTCSGPQKDEARAGAPKGYTVSKAGGKGLGAFALQPFRRGELILVETPPVKISASSNIDDLTLLRTAFQKLSPDKQQQLLSLHNAHVGVGTGFPSDPWLGIFATNSAWLGEYIVTCIHASRFNHSCSPNTKWTWDNATETVRIFALRDIAPAEEIFVSYLGNIREFRSTRETRRETLQTRFRFNCNCEVCSLPGPKAIRSDQRRTEIARLHNSLISAPLPTRDRLIIAKRMISLFREEGYAGEAADCATVAAKMCLHHSDWASAIYWARKAFKIAVDENGVDSELAAETLALWKNPKLHPEAGQGRRQMFTDVRLDGGEAR